MANMELFSETTLTAVAQGLLCDWEVRSVDEVTDGMKHTILEHAGLGKLSKRSHKRWMRRLNLALHKDVTYRLRRSQLPRTLLPRIRQPRSPPPPPPPCLVCQANGEKAWHLEQQLKALHAMVDSMTEQLSVQQPEGTDLVAEVTELRLRISGRDHENQRLHNRLEAALRRSSWLQDCLATQNWINHNQ